MDTLMDMLNTQTLSITAEILSLISSTDEFKGRGARSAPLHQSGWQHCGA
jgi:hypothetical protein